MYQVSVGDLAVSDSFLLEFVMHFNRIIQNTTDIIIFRDSPGDKEKRKKTFMLPFDCL